MREKLPRAMSTPPAKGPRVASHGNILGGPAGSGPAGGPVSLPTNAPPSVARAVSGRLVRRLQHVQHVQTDASRGIRLVIPDFDSLTSITDGLLDKLEVRKFAI